MILIKEYEKLDQTTVNWTQLSNDYLLKTVFGDQLNGLGTSWLGGGAS